MNAKARAAQTWTVEAKPVRLSQVGAVWSLAAAAIAIGLIVNLGPVLPRLQAAADPGLHGPCAASTQTLTPAGLPQTIFYYPSGDQCGSGIAGPFPGIAFAHGFSMFGLSNGAADNAGNGEHLATWGYVVAIPTLPDDAEQRTTVLRDVLAYLQTANDNSSSFLYHKIDTSRMATAGHSLGGTTALAAAARDSRVKAVVALDPVYHQSDFSGQEGAPVWNPSLEAPNITAPTGILGAPPSTCNAQADYTDIYPLVGSTHKASYLIVGANHCDFPDPGSSFCTFGCGGSTDPNRTRLSQKYMTAWFNYYLQYNTDYYDYLYGGAANADISAGRIQRQLQTAPKGLSAIGSTNAISLNWQLYDHPVVAGYDVYRRLPGGTAIQYAHLGAVPSWVDWSVTAGQVYSYTLRSYDAAGNLHQVSSEVSALASGGTSATGTATVTATATATRTPTPTATHAPAPNVTPYAYLPLIVVAKP